MNRYLPNWWTDCARAMLSRLFSLALALALPAAGAARDPWDATDTALGAVALGALALDWGQTRYIATHPERFHEHAAARVIGEHPSLGRVNSYFLVRMLGTVAIAEALPSPWRTAFLGGTVAIELRAVRRNASLGIKVEF